MVKTHERAHSEEKMEDDCEDDVSFMVEQGCFGNTSISWAVPCCAWSGPMSFKEAIYKLGKKVKSSEQMDELDVHLEIPAGSGDVREYDTIHDAIRHLKHRKREEEKRKEVEAKTGLDARFKKAFGKDRPDIRHVICLMLENRTFDGLQGDYMNERYRSGQVKRSCWDNTQKDLYQHSNTVDGPNGTVEMPVWTHQARDGDMLSEENMSIPSGPAGPVEKFHFLNLATYGVMRPTEEDLKKGPNLNGFAQQYYLKELANMPEDGTPLVPAKGGTCFDSKRSPAMFVYRKDQMPVFTGLMESFGCSDVHFSSAPCQTWPNRLMASCATSYGYYNNIPYVQPEAGVEDETSYFQSEELDKIGVIEKIFSSYDTDTVFDRLYDNGVSWGIYHGQVSLAVATSKMKYELPNIADSVHTLEDFAEDCVNGDLPQFCWLEPNYDAGSPEENDMHPPSNVLSGQKLVSSVYKSLRANEEVWKHSLFIVTCDEGVGSFDHVKPPRAVDPVEGHDHEYVAQLDGSPYDMSSNPFTRYGTRVPNLLVSPFIKPRSVVRPNGHDQGKAEYPFDHTSIIRTAFDLFLADPTEALTNRDAAAPSFVYALETQPVNMGPLSMHCPDYIKKDKDVHPHGTCHAAHLFGQIGGADAAGCGPGGCIKVPQALQSSWTTDLAAFFGM